MKNKRVFRLTAIVSLVLVAAAVASAVTFNDLNNYQKQKYWQFMSEDNCTALLKAGKQTEYRACALNVMSKAAAWQYSSAYCSDNNIKPMDWFHKGTITTDLYKTGKNDYLYTFSSGKTYLMKGFCSNSGNPAYPHYAYYQKNCAELGAGYVADPTLVACVKVNTAPVMQPITAKAVNEGKPLAFTVTATDKENDPLTYEAMDLPAGATFNKFSHTLYYTPDYSTVSTAEGQKVITVKFRASDTSGAFSDWTTATITVTNVNRAPTINIIPDNSVTETNTLNFIVSGTDPDGDALTYALQQALPANATFDPATGAFSFTPSYDYVAHPAVQASLQLSFKSSDATLSSAFTTTNITILDKNQAPKLNAIADSAVAENNTINFNVSATDPDSDTPLAFDNDVLPLGATFDKATGIFSYTPDYSTVSTAEGQKVITVKFRASDTSGVFSDWTTANITVTNVNRAPTINVIPDNTVTETNTLNFIVSGTDPDGDALTYALQQALPANATFDPATGAFSFTPSYDYVAHPAVQASLQLSFKSSDATLSSTFTTTNVTILDKNRPPVVTPMADQYVAITKNLTFQLTATDPDGDIITNFTNTTPLPINASLSPTGTFIFNPASNQVDTIYNIPFTATDGKDTSTAVTVKVIATKVNDPSFGMNEKTGNPTTVALGNSITRQFTLFNLDLVRYEVLELTSSDKGDPTKYISPSWISYPNGNSFTLLPNTTKIVYVTITAPAGATIGPYIHSLTLSIKDFGGKKSCGGLCANSVITNTKTINVTP